MRDSIILCPLADVRNNMSLDGHLTIWVPFMQPRGHNRMHMLTDKNVAGKDGSLTVSWLNGLPAVAHTHLEQK